ncbi:MAG TPA: hypothetical protein EYH32_08255 [Anaerolineae bacterium]|nr:hypothetical protein [Anaerolineae bacterium]
MKRSPIDWIADTAPWLAPFPTAYLVFNNTMLHLGWPWPVSVAAGAIVEALGLVAIHTALEFREHNRGLRDSDQRRAPFELAAGMVAVYFVIVTALTVLLDTASTMARYAPLIFPLTSMTGVTLLALRADHRRRVEEMVLSLAPPYNKKRHRLLRERLLAELADASGGQVDANERQGRAAAIGAERLRKATLADWRSIVASLDGDRRNLTASDVQRLLAERGFAPAAESTARRWAREARGE